MKYLIKVLDGVKKCELIEEHDSLETCRASLESRGLKLLSIEEKPRSAIREIAHMFNKKLNGDWLTTFIRQLSILLSGGISLRKSLDTLRAQEQDKNNSLVIERIIKNIDSGLSFSMSLVETKSFPKIVVTIAQVGEATGKLDHCMNILAEYLDEESVLKKNIRTALIYPGILFTTTICIIIFLLVSVFPTFANVFSTSSSGIELPSITKNIINISNFINSHYILIILFFATLFIGIKMLSKRNSFKKFTHKNILHIPILGNFKKMVIVSRISKLLALMLNSGISFVNALEISLDGIDNYHVSKELEKSIEYIKSRETIYNSLKQIDILPSLFTSMINIGEETGNLEHTMNLVNSYYSVELERASKKFTAYFEPIIILILSLFIGYIVLGIAMPTFEMLDIV